MVLDVYVFLNGGHIYGLVGHHVGIAIRCADGWYIFEYGAAGVGSSRSGNSSGSGGAAKVTVKHSKNPPDGEMEPLGQTSHGLQLVIDFGRQWVGQFRNYDVRSNNCRGFANDVATLCNLEQQFGTWARKHKLTCTDGVTTWCKAA